jgi:hypothetical protein
MSHICVVSKTFGEWYQKTNKTEDTNKLTLLAFKIIAILHNTLVATFIKLLETGRKDLFRNRSQNSCHTFLQRFTHTTYMALLVNPKILTSYIYGPTFGNAESCLFLFAAQCFNIESMQKVILWHSCV